MKFIPAKWQDLTLDEVNAKIKDLKSYQGEWLLCKLDLLAVQEENDPKEFSLDGLGAYLIQHGRIAQVQSLLYELEILGQIES